MAMTSQMFKCPIGKALIFTNKNQSNLLIMRDFQIKFNQIRNQIYTDLWSSIISKFTIHYRINILKILKHFINSIDYKLFNTDTDNSKVNGHNIGQMILPKKLYTFTQACKQAKKIGALLLVEPAKGKNWYLKGGLLDKNNIKLNSNDLNIFLIQQQNSNYRPKTKTYLFNSYIHAN